MFITNGENCIEGHQAYGPSKAEGADHWVGEVSGIRSVIAVYI